MNTEPLTVAEFRKEVKVGWPYVKVRVQTVGFVDLARESRKCLTVEGDRKGDLQHINSLARRAGIVPDGNIRCFKED